MRRSITLILAGTVLSSVLLSAPPVRYARPAISTALMPHGPGAHPELPAEFERAQEWLAGRMGSPEVAAAGHVAAFKKAQKIRTAAGFGAAWKELGPKPYVADDTTYNDTFNGAPPTGWRAVSGRITALAVDPSDASGNTVWAGSAGGGVWVTHNGGTTWKPVWDAQQSLSIGAIAFDAARPKTIYVGTGEANTSGGMLPGAGVWRSTDDGRTFVRVDHNVDAPLIGKIVARAGHVFVASSQGLWRSVDGGASYKNVKLPTNGTGLFGNWVSDVVMHPDRPSEITAAVGYARGKIAGPGNGLYRSTTGGAPGSFTRMNDSGLGSGSITDDPLGRISLAYASAPGQHHDTLWAIVQDAGLMNGKIKGGQSSPPVAPTRLNGVYRSGDDGTTWDLKATPQSFLTAAGSGLVGLSALYTPGIQAWYNEWIAVSPADENTVLVGLEEVYQTVQNAGGQGPAVWQTLGRYWGMCMYPVNVDCNVAPAGPYAGAISLHGDQHAVAFGDGGKTLYVGNDGGVFVDHTTSGAFPQDGWSSVGDTLGTTQPY